MEKDLVVIGGGPGGYAAAIRAAQLGAKVTIIEKERLGGTCLNKGCIPTKALFKSAQFLNSLSHASKLGVNIEGYNLDFSKVQERKNTIVTKLTNGVEQLVRANRIEIIEGFGRIIDENTVEVSDKQNNQHRLNAKNILIATGSKPVKPSIYGINLPGVVTSEELLDMERVPKSIVIIGGGVVGIEFAGILNAFGASVTVVEFMQSILPSLDKEIIKKLTISLRKKGIRIESGTMVKEIRKKGESLKIIAEGSRGEIEIDCETVLISAGREINVEGLNLENIGVKFDRKGIRVNKHYRTAIPSIYAIGDVIGGIMLAHVASEEGKVVAANIMGEKMSVNYDCVPNCIFTFPEVASVGNSEEELKEKGILYSVSKFMFSDNGKALTMNSDEGFVKVIASLDEKEILGVHIMGPNASDLIHEPVVAIKNMLTVEEIANAIHAHPSLSEAFLEAVEGIEGKAIHMQPLTDI
jgi:dihydrolipoamide dehydrogenase